MAYSFTFTPAGSLIAVKAHVLRDDQKLSALLELANRSAHATPTRPETDALRLGGDELEKYVPAALDTVPLHKNTVAGIKRDTGGKPDVTRSRQTASGDGVTFWMKENMGDLALKMGPKALNEALGRLMEDAISTGQAAHADTVVMAPFDFGQAQEALKAVAEDISPSFGRPAAALPPESQRDLTLLKPKFTGGPDAISAQDAARMHAIMDRLTDPAGKPLPAGHPSAQAAQAVKDGIRDLMKERGLEGQFKAALGAAATSARSRKP